MKDDTISRVAAIKAADSIIERDTSGNNDVVKAMTAWKEYIKALLSEQPDVPGINVIIDTIKNAINASTGNDAYMIGLRNGMRWCWSALTDKEPEYEDMPSTQPGWTYIEEALPKTIINEHTHDYQEYNCLCDFGDNGFDVRTYKFGNGHFWNGGGTVDKYVTAWQPLPKIPDELKPNPWGVEQDERSD